MEHRVVDGNVEDGVCRRIQDLADLTLPLLPGPFTPEVVHVQESTAQQVLAQPCGLVVAEAHRSHVRHEDERVVEQPVVREGDDDVIGLPVFIETDRGRGQFLEAAHEVDVAFRVVRSPSLPQGLPDDAPVEHSTERECPVGYPLRLGEFRFAPIPPPIPALGVSHARDEQCPAGRDDGGEGRAEEAASGPGFRRGHRDLGNLAGGTATIINTQRACQVPRGDRDRYYPRPDRAIP